MYERNYKVVSKECNHKGCSFPRFSTGFCCYHQNERTDDKWIRKGLKKNKKTTCINKVSKKRAKQIEEYKPLRNKFLLENKYCQVHDCEKRSTNLHHKRGRNGPMLLNQKYWMACCETCHPKRIHENSAWSYKHGYLLSK